MRRDFLRRHSSQYPTRKQRYLLAAYLFTYFSDLSENFSDIIKKVIPSVRMKTVLTGNHKHKKTSTTFRK